MKTTLILTIMACVLALAYGDLVCGSNYCKQNPCSVRVASSSCRPPSIYRSNHSGKCACCPACVTLLCRYLRSIYIVFIYIPTHIKNYRLFLKFLKFYSTLRKEKSFLKIKEAQVQILRRSILYMLFKSCSLFWPYWLVQ